MGKILLTHPPRRGWQEKHKVKNTVLNLTHKWVGREYQGDNRMILKELGKMSPYVRNKEALKTPFGVEGA